MTAALDVVPEGAAPGVRPATSDVRRLATSMGLLGLVVSLAGSWRASPWTDEVATLDVSRRSVAEQLDLFRTTDGVHGVYYLLQHLWQAGFGESIVAARAFSAVAIGAATALVVLIADALADRRVALWAGLAFLLLPVVPLAGAEARSTGLVIALVTWSTYLLVRRLDRGGGGWWLYALSIVLCSAVFIQSALVVLAHLVTVLWFRPNRRVVLGWCAAAGSAVLLLLPLAVVLSGQSGQVDWLPRLGFAGALESVGVRVWFGRSLLVALIVAAIVVWGLVSTHRGRASLRLVKVAVPWLVVPAAVLIAYSRFGTPMYTPRYLAHGAGAVALLLGQGLVAVPRRWLQVAAAAVLALASAGVVVAGRAPSAKEHSDWTPTAQVVAERAQPSDAVVFVPDDGDPRSPRRALDASPTSFRGLDDIGLTSDGAREGRLWDTGVPLAQSITRLGSEDRVWLVLAWRVHPDITATATSAVERAGYHVSWRWSGPTTEVVLMVRG